MEEGGAIRRAEENKCRLVDVDHADLAHALRYEFRMDVCKYTKINDAATAHVFNQRFNATEILDP